MSRFTFTKLFLSGILEGLTVVDSFNADTTLANEYLAQTGTERRDYTGNLYRIISVVME